MHTQPRHPGGVPVAGQWRARTDPRAAVVLAQDWPDPQAHQSALESAYADEDPRYDPDDPGHLELNAAPETPVLREAA